MAEVVERILNSTTHFEVFDIPPVAVDVTTITKLYRRLALKVHPDKCRDERGPEAFRRLAEVRGVWSVARAVFHLRQLVQSVVPQQNHATPHHTTTLRNTTLHQSYATLHSSYFIATPKDYEELSAISWRCVVVDEAHRLRTAGNKLTEALDEILENGERKNTK